MKKLIVINVFFIFLLILATYNPIAYGQYDPDSGQTYSEYLTSPEGRKEAPNGTTDKCFP